MAPEVADEALRLRLPHGLAVEGPQLARHAERDAERGGRAEEEDTRGRDESPPRHLFALEQARAGARRDETSRAGSFRSPNATTS